ncbi:hypothetical protein L6R29_13875 [Myxococcota bacterium]|nr:hypothetical protein [Myxococcota bacterium]
MSNHSKQNKIGLFLLGLFGFLGISVPLPVGAKPIEEEGVWVRLSIVGAKIWPVKATGECWDACGWGKISLPERGFHPYAHYLRHTGFRQMTTGWKAPDVRVILRIGPHQIVTPVVKNTTQPTWEVTKLLRVKPTDRFEVQVEDVDAWGSDRIGRVEEERLPREILEGGRLILRKVMQVESIEFKIVRLNVEKKESKIARSPSVMPMAALKLAEPSGAVVYARGTEPNSPSTSAQDKNKPNSPSVAPVPRTLAHELTAKKTAQETPKQTTKQTPKEIAKQTPKETAQKTDVSKITASPKATDTKAEKSETKKAVAEKTARTEEMRPVAQPKRLFRISMIRAQIWPVKVSQQCWDCWGKVKELPPRGLREFTPYYTQPSFREVASGAGAPDPWAEIKMGGHAWKTDVRQDTLQPVWKKPEFVRLGKDDRIEIRLLDKDAFSSEEIGVYRGHGLPAAVWEDGGVWEIPTFGQVERVFVHMERLKQFEANLPITQKPFAIPPSVQFVRVTVVKARLWPLNEKGDCWDGCPGAGTPSLPPRGLQDISIYTQNEDFKRLSEGRRAPDPRVKIQLGDYDVFITPTLNNTVHPEWNASHVFRIRGNEPLTVTVTDDDETVAHDFLGTYRSTRELIQRWAEDPIGRFSTPHLPRVFVEGGRLILRSFGQVEMLELKIEPLQQVVSDPRCEGVYRVRIAEVDVTETRADGKPWHTGIGSMKLPSPFLTVWLGSQKLETPVAHHRLKAIYQSHRLIPIRQDTTFTLEVSDFSVGLNLSVDQSVRVPFLPIRVGIGMRRDPDVQQIGQTAHLSVCELIQGAKQGKVRIPAFGRVKSVLMFFDKVR